MTRRESRQPFSASSAPPRCMLVLMLMLAGCVERRIVITSDPSGALVRLNDLEVGRTPCETDFTWFGVYDVVLRLEGYEPLITKAEAKAPIHEWPGFDLIALMIPVRKRTIVEWHFVLEPASKNTGALLERAEELRRDLPDVNER